MMLIICKLYVWIHITWEAYVTFNVYWNKWLLIAPPECSLHGSRQMEAPLKIKTVSSGELCERLHIIKCHWSSLFPWKVELPEVPAPHLVYLGFGLVKAVSSFPKPTDSRALGMLLKWYPGLVGVTAASQHLPPDLCLSGQPYPQHHTPLGQD